ncbi:pyruvate dehydrogenase [acetyl-transferring]-phosphatase 1, mitochondrial-like [Portunus trituberculatus]|uniref:[Pyruvate dehydrogenase [acetyl-transferring]]-phosphatase 1, mitochondrial n=1 Tax=Portunus trituberculatus TaxID=210409 RepID=A0A5B7EVN6_PORTR|nr:pyruvate dehydrogenase [acetyl-transferring]-phosphatase 1, mitochondrial-like [Portunus trituberculatus]MPC37505.1 [Pyruvate dehydrogenase [acetyl-transferring]]-phosphatase 1, mitochondrial [Portunus trituberculatus]
MARVFSHLFQNVKPLSHRLDRPVRCGVAGWERLFHNTPGLYAFPRPKLSPQEVSQILRQNEGVVQVSGCGDHEWSPDEVAPAATYSIDSVDSNQLASNSPIEDKLAAARCLHTTGYLFGVFDGHGGPECSQVVAKRLFDYIAASLLPRSELRRVVAEWQAGSPIALTQVYNDNSMFVSELQEIYDASLLRYCNQLLTSVSEDFSMEEALARSFTQLDGDLGREVEENQRSAVLEPLVRVALSGSVACVAHVDGPHLHIANTGDCGAVLGSQRQDGGSGWQALRLTEDHTWENPLEVERVVSEHPANEAETVVKDQRLLGLLMPFRAFGDFRFKWDREKLLSVIQRYADHNSIIPTSLTPPYLTALPEVTYHRLRPHDRFLLMASDGLWECMTPLDSVMLVGEYMSGRQTLQPVHLPHHGVTLREVEQVLEQRLKGLSLKPVDTSAATHLIRHAIGVSDTGLDHARLSHSLTLPPEVRRYFRDDISIHVIFFDSNFLRVCPIEI